MLVPILRNEDLPYNTEQFEMMPWVFLRRVIRESSEVKRCYVFPIPPINSIVALSLPAPFSGIFPMRILSHLLTVSLFVLIPIPYSHPPIVTLSLTVTVSRTLSLSLISLLHHKLLLSTTFEPQIQHLHTLSSLHD